MTLLSTLLAFVVGLGLLIVIHELGHYWVARWCGVKVLRFSLGFGKSIWRRRFGPDQTEWQLAVIPFGGYVKMLDERELDADSPAIAPQDLPRAFNRQSLGKRAAIVSAGPIANFLLAIFLYWCVHLLGVNEPIAVLGAPPTGTLAAQAGIKSGDRVVAVGDDAVQSFIDLRWRLIKAASARAEAVVHVEREGEGRRSLTLDFSGVQTMDFEADFMRQYGLELAGLTPTVGAVMPDSAAQAAGLRTEDRVLQVNGRPVTSSTDIVQAVRQSQGKPLAFEIERAGQSLALQVQPKPHPEAGWRIGAELGGRFEMTLVRYGPIAAMTQAVDRTFDMAWFSLRMLGKMVIGDVSLKNLNGPVTIADYAGQTARLGLEYYLGFLALISVSLGVLNLLPVPVLDGGHLLYYLIEFFRGSPLPDRWIELGQRTGVGLLFMLMAVALFNDVTRLLS